MPSAQTKPGFDKNYYTLPDTFYILLMVPFYSFTSAAVYLPESVPDSLGVVSTAVQYAADNYRTACMLALWGILGAHFFEGLYAAKLCRDNGMTFPATLKWFLSTQWCGAFSFQFKLKPYLSKYKKD